jgi:Sulfatase
MSGWLFACVLGSGVAIMGVEAYRFSTSPWTSIHEPLSLTLFPEATAHALEGHSIDPLAAANMDRADDQARAAYVPATTLSKRNLILIVVDALRPDHMGIYGYERNTTPNLSRIAANGQMRVIRGVHATCGDTICGLLSLVTSKIPKRFSFRPFTLQEALRRNGYRVHMILSGDHTHFYSLKNYYGNVDTFYDGTTAQRRGFFLNDDQLLVDKLASMPNWDGVPAMFQFHVMSAHILRKSDNTPGPFQPAVRYLLPIRNSHDIGPGTEKVESATNYYDNGVVATDAVVEQLLTTFARKGYLQNTLVVITADHGESLGEHGLFSHANSVREELLRIPLVLISYGYQPDWHAVSRPYTSQIDVAPTLLDELGIPRPATWSGFPLEISAGPDFTYFEQKGYVGLLDHRDPHTVWKYWLDTRTGMQHAFDLSTDPGEDRDALHKVPPALLAEWRLRALSENTVDIETF